MGDLRPLELVELIKLDKDVFAFFLDYINACGNEQLYAIDEMDAFMI